MIHMKQVMTIARAELRNTRRLTRYWIFLGAAYMATFIAYAQLSYVHGMFSSYSGTLGAYSPRFLMIRIGMYYSVIFLVGTIFIAFDLRHRDKRERIVDVLDSRPYTNLELVTGRFWGIFISAWVPIVVLSVVFELTGHVLAGLGSPLGEPIEYLSLISFVTLTIIPSLSFVITLEFLVTLLVRSRIGTATVMIVLMVIFWLIIISVPLRYGALVDVVGIRGMQVSSEIIPQVATPEVWIQRFAVLFAAFSLLGFSAAVHPRLDGGSRFKVALGSAMIMAFACFLFATVYFEKASDIRIMESWKESHAAFSREIVPDIKKIRANVTIVPGKDLLLDLQITFEAPGNAPLQKALFTLNPGQSVYRVSNVYGDPIPFLHKNGLLELSLPRILKPGEETTVGLWVRGVPDNRFAYLHSAVTVETLKFVQEDVFLLGHAPGIYDEAFVALMPGLRWLPASGPEIGGKGSSPRPIDYFSVDINVELPEGWLAAGPGRRHSVKGNSENVIFRFSPPAPVPEVALIAARFESRSMEVEGVTLEVLMNKKHMKNLDVLAETRDRIEEWVGDRLREAKAYGLEYPYDALALVEVPNSLRSYRGGWRLDSAMTPPGMLLMREMGFPTARFDAAFRKLEDFRDLNGGIEQAKWDRIRNFFMNDLSGGNIISGATHHFFLYQTSAEGSEAPALNTIMETLSNILIAETASYFSAHTFLEESDLDLAVGFTVEAYTRDRSSRSSVVDMITSLVTTRPEVWDQALDISLQDLEPWEHPYRAVNVMSLKATAIAQSVLDTLGHEKTGALLAAIRKSHAGKTFSFYDLATAGKELGYNLEDVLGDRLHDTSLPGFICPEARIYRIADSEYGTPRYQMLFTIRNDESVSGFFRFVYHYEGEGGKPETITGEPIFLAGKSTIRFGTIVSRSPSSVFLKPYLSLNRGSFTLKLNSLDAEKILKAEAFEGIEKLPYAVPVEAFVVIDDLDPGFKVIKREKERSLRISARGYKERITDHGLPIARANEIPSDWSRITIPGSYGKYRHTLALAGAGNGEEEVTFSAHIDQPGEWDLELYIPWRNNVMPNLSWRQDLMPDKKWGAFYLIITDSNGDRREIKFDPENLPPGWYPVGKIDLPEGETSVAISNKTDGDYVIADAIRWKPS